jgi:putative FmdB family regulatory protein
VPIYEYQCDACDHKFDTLQKVSDPLLTVCPKCNKPKLRKLVTAAAFQLKGTGWYVTDFKDKKPAKSKEKAESGGDAGDKKTPPEKSAGTTDTKSTETKKDTTKSKPAAPSGNTSTD